VNQWAVLALLVFTAPMLPGQDYATEKPPPVSEVVIPLTSEEQTALAAVDVRIAGVEAIAAKIEDPAYKASTLASIVDLKRRRASLGKKFDPGLYETLMHSVISRYQIVALWLKPPLLPPSAAKSTAAATPPAPAQKKTETKPAPQ